MTMNISLTPQQEKKIRKRVETGEYASVSEVVRTALRLLDRQEQMQTLQLEELRKEVMIGLNQAKRGETSVFDKAAVEDIKKRGRERMKARKKKTAQT